MNDETMQFPDEEAHLSEIETILSGEYQKAADAVNNAERYYQEALKERQDNYYDMDTRERMAVDRAMHSMDANIAELDKNRQHIGKLVDSPYFARINFREKGADAEESWYLGRFGFSHDRKLLILDWRAPLSSMFYDHDTGPAWFDAPMGRIEGEMTLKRQFRIRGGKLDYVVDNSQTVSDDILQEELSRASDDRMKTIIATIQKEQNVVIRNEKAKTMIIQGVAGSGKTSIALHRIAFLLYRFRDTITANDVLILSPSNVFSDFISDVIPELGEEPVRETDFYEIAIDLLDNVIDFEDPSDPLDAENPDFSERSRFKASKDFLMQLKEYADLLPGRILKEADYTFDGTVLEGSWIKEQFLFYKNDPILERIPVIAEEIVEEMLVRRGLRNDLPKKGPVGNWLKGKLILKNPLAVYRDFYRYIGREDMIQIRKGRLEWADVFPFLYLYNRYKGIPRDLRIKHLIVDEMQDYTPVQYEVLNRLYPANKTILGDFGQGVNPDNPTTLADLQALYPESLFVKLNKSYRSTWEIMSFANAISPQADMELVDRHGPEPEVHMFRDNETETEKIRQLAEGFQNSGYASLGIILKSQKAADTFYETFKDRCPGLTLLNSGTKEFKNGISVTSVKMAKGLEFDEVIIPSVNDSVYHTEHDRMLLYIACTRAMHELYLTGSGDKPDFLP